MSDTLSFSFSTSSFNLTLAMEEEGLQKQIDTINLETKRKIEA